MQECANTQRELDLFVLAELPSERMGSIRAHATSCEACQAELAVWRELASAAESHRTALVQQLRPEDEALADLMAAIREPEPVAPARRRRLPLAMAASLLLATAGAIIWGLLGVPERTQQALIDDVALVELEPGAELPLQDGQELAALARGLRGRLAQLEVRLGPHARLRQSDSGPPRRLTVLKGEVELVSNGEAETLVRIGDLDVTVHPGTSVVIDAPDADTGSRRVQVDIRVREGRIALRLDLGREPGHPIEIPAGETAKVTVDGDLAHPATRATAVTVPGDGQPVEITLAEEPIPEPPPDPEDEPVTPAPTDDTPDPEGEPEQEPEPAPVGPGELPPGVILVVMPQKDLRIGDVAVIQVWCGTGDRTLGGYNLELNFATDSDLRVALVGDPRSVPTKSRPLLHDFDAARQVLRIVETTGRAEGLGSGTFTLLQIEVQVLEGSPGDKRIGGQVDEFIDAESEDPIGGQPSMRTLGTLRIRQ
jgi:hypothetical protein